MRFLRILKILTGVLGGLFLIVFLLPAPNIDTAENELAEFVYQKIIGKSQANDIDVEQLREISAEYLERQNISPDELRVVNIVAWYPPFDETNNDHEEGPIRLWWYENGEGEEILVDKRETMQTFHDSGLALRLGSYTHNFSIEEIRKFGSIYIAKVNIANISGHTSGAGYQWTLIRLPSGWFRISITMKWISIIFPAFSRKRKAAKQ